MTPTRIVPCGLALLVLAGVFFVMRFRDSEPSGTGVLVRGNLQEDAGSGESVAGEMNPKFRTGSDFDSGENGIESGVGADSYGRSAVSLESLGQDGIGDSGSRTPNLIPEVVTDEQWNGFTPTHRAMIARLAKRGDGGGGDDAGDDAGDGSDDGEGSPPVSPWICFVPGASQPLVKAMGHLSQEGRGEIGGEYRAQAFQFSSRWSKTATNPGARGGPNALRQGDPITLTWSIIPDGTTVPGGANGAGEASSPSNLVSWLNGLYGSQANWLPLFQSVFDRWGELTGIRYVYEPNDDGASFPFTDGSLGARGDVRIGGHYIDGPFGVLAYNYYPSNGGNMVIDTADTYLESTASNSLRLRNTIAHEHGHGMGLRHVCPIENTKLMEPFLSTAFDGPQLDDIFSAQRQYGDALEDTNSDAESDDNDALGRAASLGTLAPGVVSFADLSIDDSGDQDYYQVTPSGAGFELSVTLSPVGASYLEGAQNSDGSCSSGITFDSRIIHDIGFEVLDDAGAVLASRDSSGAGSTEFLSDLPLPTGAFHVRVFGGGANNAQLYDLEISLTDPAALPELRVFSASAGEPAGAVTFQVQLSAASSAETSVSFATSAGSATEGADYTEASGTLAIPIGQTAASIEVLIDDDTLDEDDEGFTLTLSDPVGVSIAVGVASGTILDDELAPSLSIDDPEVAETAGTARFEVTLSAVSGKTVEVDYATASGSADSGVDFIADSGRLTIPAGESGGGVDIDVADDGEAETDESFGMVLTNPANAVLGDATGAAIIFDDEAIELLASTGSFDSSSTAGEVTINWDAVPGRQYTILYSADLIVWAPLVGAELITASSGSESFTHPDAPIERGFYRIVEDYNADP